MDLDDQDEIEETEMEAKQEREILLRSADASAEKVTSKTQFHLKVQGLTEGHNRPYPLRPNLL